MHVREAATDRISRAARESIVFMGSLDARDVTRFRAAERADARWPGGL
jgi:hypothetical protein